MKYKLLVVFIAVTLLASCSPRLSSHPDSGDPAMTDNSIPEFADFPDLGKAPEFTNDIWLNTNNPLRITDLRGKVILLDMWTFG
jgi:hypothetical protein